MPHCHYSFVSNTWSTENVFSFIWHNSTCVISIRWNGMHLLLLLLCIFVRCIGKERMEHAYYDHDNNNNTKQWFCRAVFSHYCPPFLFCIAQISSLLWHQANNCSMNAYACAYTIFNIVWLLGCVWRRRCVNIIESVGIWWYMVHLVHTHQL